MRAVLAVFSVLSAALMLGACAAAPQSGNGPADPTLEAHAETATRPMRQLQVLFDWSMSDRDARMNGRGVLRLDRDRRGRVDLFDPRGITLAAAVLEGDQMRVVPAGADALLPPPALLWAALGVFRRPADAPLTATAAADGSVTLHYARDATRWRFTLQNDVLRSIEWTATGGRRTVELTGTAQHGLPAQAAFRDWTEFRELTLRVTEVEERSGFEPDVWMLPGQ